MLTKMLTLLSLAVMKGDKWESRFQFVQLFCCTANKIKLDWEINLINM